MDEAWPRKLLIVTSRFFPSIGGVQSMALGLATAFHRRGRDVTVMTNERSSLPDNLPFRVVRRPTALGTWKEFSNADAIIQFGPGVRLGWPLLLRRFPVVISHQIWQPPIHSESPWHQRLRARMVRRSINVSPSEAMARTLNSSGRVIGNAYDDKLFRIRPDVQRDRDLIFVGRLIPEKGADLLIEAVGKLAARGLRPNIAIVGSGPELEKLKQLAAEIHLQDRCFFRGALVGEALVEELNRHRILVVPSRWNEPFGIVALEGIACGCVVCGSDGGGLPDAIGPCGFLFTPGSADSLAELLYDVLGSDSKQAGARVYADKHLQSFTGSVVTDRYLSLLRQHFDQPRRQS